MTKSHGRPQWRDASLNCGVEGVSTYDFGTRPIFKPLVPIVSMAILKYSKIDFKLAISNLLLGLFLNFFFVSHPLLIVPRYELASCKKNCDVTHWQSH